MKYHPIVHGVIVSVDQIQFGKGTGEGVGLIHNELPFIHFKIEFQAVVFRPNVTKTIEGGGEEERNEQPLPGVVNKVSSGHVGILIYGVFNASISGGKILRVEGREQD